jgi:PncC family amidohydrolase
MDSDTSKLLGDIGDLLKAKGWTISTAESCTGGLISNLLTSIPGSSDYFVGGIIAYSNEIKRCLLSVSPGTLEVFGAVSSETVKEMAAGVKRLFKSDIGISTSGIAGPTGGTKEKPVGTVAIGVDIPRKIITNIEHLKGERNEIREQAGIQVLKKLRSLLEEIK